MKVNFLGRFPKNYSRWSELEELEELDSYEIEDLSELGLDEIWYWYSTAPYEGSGQILMRKGDLYDLYDAGHGSDYGPTERVDFKGQKLDELAESLSDEYMENEAKELFELAGWPID